MGVALHTTRLFLHVLAATVWVGGQLTLAALVPTLRALGKDAPRAAARRFNQVAWPAFWVLVLTGVWNAVAEWDELTGRHRVAFVVKVVVVAASGASAYAHTRARTPRWLGIWGALSGLSALAALFVGVLLEATM